MTVSFIVVTLLTQCLPIASRVLPNRVFTNCDWCFILSSACLPLAFRSLWENQCHYLAYNYLKVSFPILTPILVSYCHKQYSLLQNLIYCPDIMDEYPLFTWPALTFKFTILKILSLLSVHYGSIFPYLYTWITVSLPSIELSILYPISGVHPLTETLPLIPMFDCRVITTAYSSARPLCTSNTNEISNSD